MLLASDEFNIFAVAKYLRLVADRGVEAGRTLPLRDTRREYPGLDFAAYAINSRDWPADNIRALGSEYTSRAWDDRLVAAWGTFVYEAYLDVTAQASAAPARR